MRFLVFNKYFSPDDILSSGTGDGSKFTKNDILDLLDDETGDEKPAVEKKPVEEKEEVTKEDETTDDEDDEKPIKLDDELETDDEVTDEKLELQTPARRRDILAAYPDLFKKFPYLETAYYREQKYTEILPTIDDAKEAVERSEQLTNFERELSSGSNESILKSLKENDSSGFNKLVDNYLPSLAKVDQNAYLHIIGNISANTIKAMIAEAGKSNNEDLKTAASILNQFVFGSADIVKPAKFSNEPEVKDNSVAEERAKFNQERFTAARDDLGTKVYNLTKSTIDNHIDPKGEMTDYVKKNATKDCLALLDDNLVNDKGFKIVINKLWERSAKENFSEESKNKIRSAYLSRAKAILPELIKKSRNEALKGLGKMVRTTEDKDKRGPITKGRSTADSGKTTTPKDTIPKGMTTRDYLMQD